MAFPHRDKIKEALLEYIESRGGAVSAGETYEPLARKFHLTEEDLALAVQNGAPGSKWPNELQWTREDLVREEYLLPYDPSNHGIWKLAKPPIRDKLEQELVTIYQDLADERVFDPANASDARDIILRAIVQRRGQQDFRKLLLIEYKNRCAISGETCVAVLEAAHIVPYQGIETNHIQNGLLLRADIHTLFDLSLIAINSSYQVDIAPSLRSSGYKHLEGKSLLLPTSGHSHPSKIALELHRSKCKF